MNSVDKSSNSIATKITEIGAFTVKNADPAEKVAKIAYRAIDSALIITHTVSKPWSNLSTELKDSATIFESLKVFGALKMIACPDAQGRYFLTNSQNTWQKRADRLTLLAHTSFKTVKGLSKAGFVNLGVMSKEVIGRLPAFTLAMDSFIVLSSIFGWWDTMIVGLPKANESIARDEDKLAKWEYRPLAIAYLRIDDETEKTAFKNKYMLKAQSLEKLLKVNADKVLLKEEKIKEIEEDKTCTPAEREAVILSCRSSIQKFEKEANVLLQKQKKNDARLEKIETNNWKDLIEDLTKQQIYGQGGKINKWEVVKHNDQIAKNKSWLKIANSVGKIAVVTFALTLTSLFGAAWAVPFALSVLALGIVVDSLGLVKILYDEFGKPLPIPKPCAA